MLTREDLINRAGYTAEEADTALAAMAELPEEVDHEADFERVKLTCCDGTGWTGNPKAPCADHYEPNGAWV